MSNQVTATLKYALLSDKKMNLIASLVRGKKVVKALDMLEFMPKKGARTLHKLIKSAAANAVHNEGAEQKDLYIKKIYVDEGPTLKRFRAKAKGQGTQILKRTCHITCVVEDR